MLKIFLSFIGKASWDVASIGDEKFISTISNNHECTPFEEALFQGNPAIVKLFMTYKPTTECGEHYNPSFPCPLRVGFQ